MSVVFIDVCVSLFGLKSALSHQEHKQIMEVLHHARLLSKIKAFC